MPQYKFDDCNTCRFRRRKNICRDCDFGEYFEDAESFPELDFSAESSFSRSNKSLVTEDDEPNFNPDDLISTLEEDDLEETPEHED